MLQAQKVTASHVRGAPPIIHKGWTKAKYEKAKAEFEKKDPDPNKASDGVIPLPRENASKSAIIQATIREIEADMLNITGEANQVE